METNKLEIVLNQPFDEIRSPKQNEQVVNRDIAEKGNEPDLNDWIAERELANFQIEFLNSIVADQQTKIQELTARLSSIEADGENYYSNGKIREIAPRMYCDICEVFDAHETDDCEKQVSNSPPPTQNHKPQPRNLVRLYCEHCERFGHDCAEEETF